LPNPIGVDDLQALVVTGPDGDPYVQLTSRRALSEPALSFLVRLTWDEGRLVREYSVLLDPPALAHSAPLDSEPEAPALPAAPAQAVAPRPARSQPTPPPPSGAQSTEALAGASEAGERSYGPVRRGENLSRIALENYPEHRANLAHMVRVLFRRNRHAFVHDDPNLLMQGSTLVLPGRVEMDRAVARLAAEKPTRLAAAPDSPDAAGADPAPAAPSALPQEYGPVQRNETLYEIAEQLVGDRRTGVHELMQRIHERNPDAFIDGDADLLKEGAVLEIPSATVTGLARAEPENAPPAPADERLRQEHEDVRQLLGALREELTREREHQLELQERFALVEERLQALWIVLDDAKDYREPAGPTIEHPSNTPGARTTPADAEPTQAQAAEATVREESPVPPDENHPSPAGTATAPAPSASIARTTSPPSPAASTAGAPDPSMGQTESAPPPEPPAQTVSRARERSGSGLGELLRELPKQVAIVLSLWLLIVIGLQWRNRNKLTPEEDLADRRRQQAQSVKQRLARLRERHNEGYNRNKQPSDQRSKPADAMETQRWNAKRLAQEAAIYFSYGEHERAMECIEEAIALEPAWIGNRVLKLRILEGLGRKEEARTLARRLMEQAQHLPKDLRAYVEEISRGKHRAA
ncbi:MAG: hypothetical protein GWN84_18455, partial [Gammaproteobacteria bacterium]|nr:hypothetical protein [Gammaproteobacteria bacterium]NIR84815.1 hypothetical protein [Gammaproteobacteria bacterium]NIR91529.1 hypothetical protein [Gammaproteobacteria bacterium]NIU05862.1 hypothetical protein [Gammaproteobacteria bacterium]NIV76717.1 hypothetical protein [Gammaproteobacteria bacterium]